MSLRQIQDADGGDGGSGCTSGYRLSIKTYYLAGGVLILFINIFHYEEILRKHSGNIKIPHNKRTIPYWEALVACLLYVCHKLQKAIWGNGLLCNV